MRVEKQAEAARLAGNACGHHRREAVIRRDVKRGVGIEKQMTVTVTCDHRIISGADAAVFLKDFAAAVENPATLTK